jgi:hypothetical protein
MSEKLPAEHGAFSVVGYEGLSFFLCLVISFISLHARISVLLEWSIVVQLFMNSRADVLNILSLLQ